MVSTSSCSGSTSSRCPRWTVDIAGAIYEWIKRGVFRVLGRPDPGPADTAMMLPVAWVIGGALLVMGIILIIADLVSPVRLF